MSEERKTKVFVRAAPTLGRYRAGQFWPHEGREAEVTDVQLAALEGDLKLFVVRKADAPKPAAKPAREPAVEPSKKAE